MSGIFYAEVYLLIRRMLTFWYAFLNALEDADGLLVRSRGFGRRGGLIGWVVIS
jgi:hypothetical protein